MTIYDYISAESINHPPQVFKIDSLILFSGKFDILLLGNCEGETKY